ncbi:MAG: DUF3795 domain-containing protein [Eubacteriales bacterium]
MKTICGLECEDCHFSGMCNGCTESGGCPLGKKCFIYDYIKKGGLENYNAFKQGLIDEFNALGIEGMPKIDELYALFGSFVNLPYRMPSGEDVKLLDDSEIYLGTQVECEFGGRCYGLAAGLGFLLVCEYGEGGVDPEIVIFKRR